MAGLTKAPKSVQVIADNSKALEKALRELTKRDVYVGIPSTEAARPATPEEPKPINNAVIGYVMEHGMPEMNVPARAWLVPGVQAAAKDITPIFRKAGQNALAGNTEDVDRGMNAAGLKTQSIIKMRVDDGIAPELKESTLAARRSRGHQGTTPLVETHKFVNAIKYVIRDRK